MLVYYIKMPFKRKYRKKRKTTKKKPKRTPQTYSINRSINTGFPESALVKFRSKQMLEVNPGANAAVGGFEVNMNNPLDPIGTLLTGTSATHAETHPLYWNTYESVYQAFRVVSAKITVTWLNNNLSQASVFGIVPLKDGDGRIATAQFAGLHYGDYAKKFGGPQRYVTAGSGSNAKKVVLSNAQNIQRLQGVTKDQLDETYEGTTVLHSSGQTSPALTPRWFVYMHALVSTIDLNTATCIVDIEYVTRFYGLNTEVVAPAV